MHQYQLKTTSRSSFFKVSFRQSLVRQANYILMLNLSITHNNYSLSKRHLSTFFSFLLFNLFIFKLDLLFVIRNYSGICNMRRHVFIGLKRSWSN